MQNGRKDPPDILPFVEIVQKDTPAGSDPVKLLVLTLLCTGRAVAPDGIDLEKVRCLKRINTLIKSRGRYLAFDVGVEQLEFTPIAIARST